MQRNKGCRGCGCKIPIMVAVPYCNPCITEMAASMKGRTR
jgi:hypothetical protein